MKDFNWKDWLAEYNQALIANLDFAQDRTFIEPGVSPELIASGRAGYVGASETELGQLETRLGMQLPASYRTFLATSNGFRQPGKIVPRLFSTKEIDWLRVKDPESIDAWMPGAISQGPVPPIPDPEYLRTALQISARETVGTAIYLLNPQVISLDGEWEAWYFAHWLPGAHRYRSFWDLMQWERGVLLEELNARGEE